MKLQDLNPGQTITHWCAGQLVTATVARREGEGIYTHHEPVRWGK